MLNTFLTDLVDTLMSNITDRSWNVSFISTCSTAVDVSALKKCSSHLLTKVFTHKPKMKGKIDCTVIFTVLYIYTCVLDSIFKHFQEFSCYYFSICFKESNREYSCFQCQRFKPCQDHS